MKKTANKFFAKAAIATTKLTASVFGLLITTEMAMAQGGLTKPKQVMETFKEELITIIPTIAVIALLSLAIGYATKFVEKDTFVRWAIGIIIAGSAAQITALFLT